MTYSQVGAGVPRPAKTRDPRSRVGKCTAAAGEETAIAKWINQGRGEMHSAPGDSQNIVIVRVIQIYFKNACISNWNYVWFQKQFWNYKSFNRK